MKVNIAKMGQGWERGTGSQRGTLNRGHVLHAGSGGGEQDWWFSMARAKDQKGSIERGAWGTQ